MDNYRQNQNLAESTARNFFEMKNSSKIEYAKLPDWKKWAAKQALLALLPHLLPPNERIILILRKGFQGIDCNERINAENLNILVKNIFEAYLEWLRSIRFTGSTYASQVEKEEDTARLILEYAISQTKMEYEICQNGSIDSFIGAFIEWVITNIVSQYDTLVQSELIKTRVKELREIINGLPVPTRRQVPEETIVLEQPQAEVHEVPVQFTPSQLHEAQAIHSTAWGHLNQWAKQFHGPWADWEHNMRQPNLRKELLQRLNELTHRDGSEGRPLIQMQFLNENRIPTRVVKRRVEYLEKRKREMASLWGSVGQPRTRNRRGKGGKGRKGRKTRKN